MSSYYDSYDYYSFWEGREYEDLSEKIALSKLFSIIPKENRNNLFDIGGGFGRLSGLYSKIFKDCKIIEPSIDLINKGKKINKFANVVFIQASLPHLSKIGNQKAENVLMIRVIHHLSDPLPSLKEISRIIAINGYFILEIANKVHFLARLKAIFNGNWEKINNFEPIDQRSKESIKQNKITFINHHPQKIINDLKSLNFEIIKVVSVSNFRSPILKKIVPVSILIFFEKIFQKHLSSFFGPSIFLLAKKQ